jgi:hypothetical protein
MGAGIVHFTSRDYWSAAPVATGVDRAGGLIPPFPDTSVVGDGATVIESGVMTVRPLPLGIAFVGATQTTPVVEFDDVCCEDLR